MAKITSNKRSKALSMLLVISMVLSSVVFTLPVTAEETTYGEEASSTLLTGTDDGAAFLGAITEKTVLWSEDFDGLSEPRSNWETAMYEDNTPISGWAAVSASTGDNHIIFDGEKLVMKKQQEFTGTNDLVRVQIPITNIELPTTGYVAVEFDYTQDIEWVEKYQADTYIKDVSKANINKFTFGSSYFGLDDITSLGDGARDKILTRDSSVYVGNTVRVQVMYDIAKSQYTMFYTKADGTKYQSPAGWQNLEGNKAFSLGEIFLQQSCSNKTGGVVTISYDNMAVVAYPQPDVVSTTVPEGNNASISDSFALTFDEAMLPQTMANITLTPAEGDAVALTPAMSNENKTVTLTHAVLEKDTSYTLTVPATVLGASGAPIKEAKTYTFRTTSGAITEKTILWSENFDGLSAPRSNWTPAIMEDNASIGAWAAISASTGDNHIIFDGSKLIMKKQQEFTGTNDLVRLQIPITNIELPTTGYVAVEFDYTQDIEFGSKYDADTYIREASKTKNINKFTFGGGDFGLDDSTNASDGDTSKRLTADKSVYVGNTVRVQVMYDIANSKYTMFYTKADGTKYQSPAGWQNLQGNVAFNGLGEIFLQQKCTNKAGLGVVTISYDNMAVVAYPQPDVVSTTVPEGDDASITDSFALTFDEAMLPATMENITLTPAEGDAVVLTPAMSNENKTVTLTHAGLQNSTTYTLTVPVTVFGASGTPIKEAKTYTFKTTSVDITEKTVLWSENFDGLSAPRSGWGVGMFEDDVTISGWTAVSASTGDNHISFDGSKLIMKKQQEFTGTNDLVKVQIPLTNIKLPTTGYVAVEFDYTQDIEWVSKYEPDTYIKDGSGNINKFTFGGGWYGLDDTTNLASGDITRRLTADKTVYVGNTVRVQVMYDIANSKYIMYYTKADGTKYQSAAGWQNLQDNKTFTGLGELFLQQKCTKTAGAGVVTISYDNMAVVAYPQPDVVSTTVPEGNDASITDGFAITFDEAMLPATMANITLTPAEGDAVVLTSAMSNENKTVTLTHAGLKNSTTYTLTVPVTVFGASGTPIKEAKTYTFTTGVAPAPVEGPKVTAVNGFTNGGTAPIGQAFKLTFDKAMNAESLANITLVKKSDGTAVALTTALSTDSKIVTLYHRSLDYSTEYELTVPTTVKSAADEFVTTEIKYTFTTKAFNQGIWSETFETPWNTRELNAPFSSAYGNDWEVYIGGNTNDSKYDPVNNAFVITDKGLNFIKSQGALRGGNLLATKSLYDSPDTGLLTLDFDFTMDAPYQSYAYFPIVSVCNTKSEQMLSLNFGSTYYGIFVNPQKDPGVYSTTSAFANTDSKYAFVRNNADKLAEICDGDLIHVSIFMDLDSKTYTVKLTTDGQDYYTPTAKFTFDPDLSNLQIGKVILCAQETIQTAYETPVTTTFDNIVLAIPEAVVPTIVSRDVTHSIVKAPSFTFDTPINEASLAGITLTKGGEAVDFTPVLSSDGKTLTITHTQNFAYGSEYVLTLPNTLKSSTNGAFAGEVVTITTIAEAPTKVGTIWSNNFDSYDANTTMPTGWTAFVWVDNTSTTSYAERAKYDNKYDFVDGKLVMTKQQNEFVAPDKVVVKMPFKDLPTITSDLVSLEFDVKQNINFVGDKYQDTIYIQNSEGKNITKLALNNASRGFQDTTNGQNVNYTHNSIAPATDYIGKNMHVEVLYDLKNSKYTIFYTVDGVRKMAAEGVQNMTADTFNLSALQFVIDCSQVAGSDPVIIEVDNMAVVAHATPATVTSNVTGSTNVATDGAISLTFSEAMKAEDMSYVTLKTAAGEAVTLTPSTSDNLTYTFAHATLTAATDYSLVVPTGLSTASGKVVNGATFAFKTAEAVVDPDPIVAPTATIVPANNATDVKVGSNIVITFSKAMNVDTLGNITVKAGSTNVTYSKVMSNGDKVVTITPSANLAYGTVYTVTIPATVKSADNGVFEAKTYTFTTEAEVIIPDPIVAPTATIVPANNATNVKIDSNIVITFSKAMNLDTLGNITIKAGSTNVTYSKVMSNGDKVVTITPNADFAYGTVYTVTIPATVKSADNGVFEAKTYTFTTEAEVIIPDPIVAPTATIVPANNATNVKVDSNIVITFSKAMNTASLNNIVVKAGSLPITFKNVISNGDTVVTITPNADFAYGTVYTVTIPATVKSADNGVFEAKTYTFTTEQEVVTPPVDPEDNVLWAENFDGLSAPKTGWAVAMYEDNVPISDWKNVSTSTGDNHIIFDGSKLVIKKQQEYTGANDLVRVTIPFTNIKLPTTGYVAFEYDYTQDIEWKSKYESDTYIRNKNGSNITKYSFGGGSYAFDDLTNLAEGASTKRITADKSVYVGNTVHVQVMYDVVKSLYTIYYTKADGTKYQSPAGWQKLQDNNPFDLGQLLLQVKCTNMAGAGVVTLSYDNMAVVAYSQPEILAITPVQGATDVAIGSNITVKFNTAMDVETLKDITLKAGDEIVELIPLESNDNKEFTFIHSDLASNKTYTLTVPNTVKSTGGIALAEEYVSTFTTATVSTPTTPLVLKASLVNGQKDVSVTDSFDIKFSKPMSGASIGNITLTKGGTKTALIPTMSADGTTASLAHGKLAYSSEYVLTIPVTVKSADGMALTTEVTYTFTTVEAPTPELKSASVTNGAIGVSVTDSFELTFTEEMDLESLANITLKAGDTPVALKAILSNGNKTAKLSHDMLAYETEYVLTIPTTVKSVDNVALASATTYTFTTEIAPITETTVLWSEDFTRTEPGAGWTVTVKDGAGAIQKWPEVSTEKEDKIELKDGKLVITKRQVCNGTDTTYVNIPLTGLVLPESGVVAVEFDYTQHGSWAAKYQRDFQINNNQGQVLFGSCFGSNYYGFNDCTGVNVGSETIKNNITQEINYKNSTLHVEIVYNIDAGTYEVYYTPENGARKLGTRGTYRIPEGVELSMKSIQFTISCSNKDGELPVVVEYDNVKVVAHPVPVIVSEPVADGERGVSIKDDLVIAFSEAMNAESLGNISLLQGDNNVPIDIELSEDGKVVTLSHGQFNYNTTYTINIPLTVKSVSGKSMTVEKTYKFTTEVPPVAFTVNTLSVVDENGDKIQDLSTVSEVNSTVKITNASATVSRKATVIIAMYDGNGLMKKIVCKQITLAAGATTEALINFAVEGAEADYTIEVMAVDDFNLMQAMINAVKLP